jgi:hypothetical protein
LALNHFADWTDAEYEALLGFKPEARVADVAEATPVSDLPESINWVEKGMVTLIKD